MKKVITYGTFDLLHIGHINILEQARELGDFLIVALSNDKFNREKGKSAYHSYMERKAILESIMYVDLVIEEYSWDQKKNDIEKYNIDYFVIGSDWEGKFDYLSDYCKVIYLPRTEGISTSKIKTDLKY
ncbi:glycerol-3-phosphate cytidylyltransferase [Gracilibacillus lacisalsi]|uniref:glycerol-3-phosphate cytidylyltransferase n=1 Tax=Gracilibacillus lacisalsi TaxID=393087 RepID=UPI00035F4D07|nr:glycerol-3-phosphate cytidylyltransferase [Gracilibacillus lacisalsi]